MANWTTLKAAIANVIKTNGNQEITGAVLQNTLNSIVNAVGENATFVGIATPTTNPGAPDGPVFYFANNAGVYDNFDGIELENPGLVVLYNLNGAWKSLKVYECLQDLGNSTAFPMSQKATTSHIMEINVSVQYPTNGIDGTQLYTLEMAIAQIPNELRKSGLKCSFLNESRMMETWEFYSQGNYAFLSPASWYKVGGEAIQEAELPYLAKKFKVIYSATAWSFKTSVNSDGSITMRNTSEPIRSSSIDLGSTIPAGKYILVASIFDIEDAANSNGLSILLYNAKLKNDIKTPGLYYSVNTLTKEEPMHFQIFATFTSTDENDSITFKINRLYVFEYNEELEQILSKVSPNYDADLASALLADEAKRALLADEAKHTLQADEAKHALQADSATTLNMEMSPFKFLNKGVYDFSNWDKAIDISTYQIEHTYTSQQGAFAKASNIRIVKGEKYIFICNIWDYENDNDNVEALLVINYNQRIMNVAGNGFFYTVFTANDNSGELMQIGFNPWNVTSDGTEHTIRFKSNLFGFIEYSDEALRICEALSLTYSGGYLNPFYSLQRYEKLRLPSSSFNSVEQLRDYITNTGIDDNINKWNSITMDDYSLDIVDGVVNFSGTFRSNQRCWIGFSCSGKRNLKISIKGSIKATNLGTLSVHRNSGIDLLILAQNTNDNEEVSFFGIKEFDETSSSSSYYYYTDIVPRQAEVAVTFKIKLDFYCIFDGSVTDEVIRNFVVGDCIYIPKFLDPSIPTQEQMQELVDKTASKVTSPYSGMHCVVMGDSHAVQRASWIPKICDAIGAIYEAEICNALDINNYTGVGYEAYVDPMYCQAMRCIEQYNQGKQIDLIFMENVHYTDNGSVEDAFPLKIKNTISLGQYSIPPSKVNSWFTSNFNSFISKYSTPILGTVANVQYSNTSHVLTFGGTPSAGNFVLTLDGQTFSTEVLASDSLSSFVSRLNTYAFGDYTDWSNSMKDDNSIVLSYKGSDNLIPTLTVSFNAGQTGITMTQSEQNSYTYAYFYFESYDNSDWTDVTKWTRVYGFGGFTVLKGVFELLLENMPNVTIIALGVDNYSLKNPSQYDTPLGFDIGAFMKNDYLKKQNSDIFLKAARLYKIKTVDLRETSCINPINYTEFMNYDNVHPKTVGYERWADTIIRELL